MNNSSRATGERPLWFEPFLRQLKQELGYALDIKKYGLLLTWANENQWGSADLPFDRLYAVCKALFLQNHDHEHAFRSLFCSYLVDELAYERTVSLPGTGDDPVPPPDNSVTNAPGPGPSPERDNLPLRAESDLEPEPADEAAGEELTGTRKYLNFIIPASPEAPDGKADPVASSPFLLSDAYLPLTRREMIHGWRRLRKPDQFRPGNRIDVKATVQRMAREGVLLQPVFEKEYSNSDDLLVILADRRGSMTPFHRLTDKLVETAVQEGGHRKALVYYFSNYPVDVVYKNPNLTEPVALAELYSRIRPDHTNALVISDAGAARGNMSEVRVEKTLAFLNGSLQDGRRKPGLHKSALFVAWLNPMPQHRWTNTTAAAIANDPNTPMYPLMEDAYVNFISVIEKLLGK